MNPLGTTARIGALAAIAAALPALLPAQDAPAPPSISYGTLTLHGYDLREARFPRPYVEHLPDGTTREHAAGWQIRIRGANLPIRALDPVLWIDDEKFIWVHERHDLVDEQELVFNVVDPALLRSERNLTVMYGKDERTRTKMLERLDPERLVKLPDAERRALGIPELEGLTISQVGADGSIEGRGRLTSGRVVLALRRSDGRIVPAVGPVALRPDGTFATRVVGITPEVTHVAALLVTEGAETPRHPFEKLPKGIELLDSKPVGAKRAGR
jgi:hypothetical protein